MTEDRAERAPMTPLQAIGMGFVVVAIDTLGRFDLLPDVIGWALVLWGLSRLRLPERGQLLAVAGACAVVALVMWFPQAHEPVRDVELALKWALSLPDLLFIFLFSRALATAAEQAGDRRFAKRFGVTGWATVVVAALPPIADAAGSEALLGYADVAFVVLWLWLIWNSFAAHATPYAAAREVA